MNKTRFAAIVPDLKIGAGCTLMDVSGILEYHGCLSYAISYSNFDFLYNKERLTEFINPKRPEEYISKDDDLVIEVQIDSAYHQDIVVWNNYILEYYDLFQVKPLTVNLENDLDDLKRNFLDNDIPLIFPCDHYYMYDDYKKYNSNILRYHSSNHMAVLMDVNVDEQKCYIIDKFFAFVGEISLESFLSAALSDHLQESKGNCGYVEFKQNEYSGQNEKTRVKALLKKSLELTLKPTVNINNQKYYKNTVALEMFMHDFSDFLDKMLELKGKYAPQFTSKLFHNVMLQRVSFSNLVGYISKYMDLNELDQLKRLTEDAAKLWLRIDALCDKCYLKGNLLTDYTDRFLQVLSKIYDNETEILRILKEI